MRQYKYDDIASVEKMPNPGYAPRYDIILPEGEARINRDSTLVAADILTLEDTFFLNPEKTETVEVVAAPAVCIETHMSGIAEVYVAKAQAVVVPKSEYAARMQGLKTEWLDYARTVAEMSADWTDYYHNGGTGGWGNEGYRAHIVNFMQGLKAPKPKKDEPSVTLNTFTYKSLFESEVDVTRSESINGTVKLEFTLPEAGIWFVYLRKKNICWVISLPAAEQEAAAK